MSVGNGYWTGVWTVRTERVQAIWTRIRTGEVLPLHSTPAVLHGS
jgi:hypothetical protein